MTEVRYPDVMVHLSGGSVFTVIGIVGAKLRRAGHADVISEFAHDIASADSYHEALRRVMKWVTVT